MRRIGWIFVLGALGACGDATLDTGASTTTTSGEFTSSTGAGGSTSDCPPPPGPEALGTLMTGNPTDASLALSVLPAAPLELFVEFGGVDQVDLSKTDVVKAQAGEPVTFALGGLAKDAAQRYRVRYRAPGCGELAATEDKEFHTQRKAGEPFTFTIQADSHRDEGSNLDLYRRALDNIRADRGDFHVDLGDTFMTEKFAQTRDEVVHRYVEERDYFGRIGDVVPLFLANGNHEGEAGWLDDGTADNMAVWTTNARLRYYVNPLPDGFYSGDGAEYPHVGKRGGYYAWEWGDALFVVLDPFWFTKAKAPKGNTDGWRWTLGDAQYHFLEATLQSSKARYKLVFSHHLIGGADDARGGVEMADWWEWGGKNPSGADEFAAKRPGWARPIHQLFLDTHVSAWFHGHDHLYCKQDKDGIVYQEVPQPSHVGENGAATAAEWGYTQGTIRSSSGHLRLTVTSQKITVEYVRAFLPQDEKGGHVNGEIGDSYTILPP